MELSDRLPIEAPCLRCRLEELIGALDGAAYDTQQPEFKHVLGRTASTLGWIYDTTTPEEALEHLLTRSRAACEQAYRVAGWEASAVSLNYEWLLA